METIRVRPSRRDLLVLDEATGRPIPADWSDVPNNGYWQKALYVGDVVQDAPQPSKPNKTK